MVPGIADVRIFRARYILYYTILPYYIILCIMLYYTYNYMCIYIYIYTYTHTCVYTYIYIYITIIIIIIIIVIISIIIIMMLYSIKYILNLYNIMIYYIISSGSSAVGRSGSCSGGRRPYRQINNKHKTI